MKPVNVSYKKIITFDPSGFSHKSKPAYAIFNNRKLVKFSEISRQKKESMTKYARRLFNLIKEENPDLVIVEGQYLDKNVNSMQQLIEYRSLIQAICYLQGIEVIVVQPSTWQGRVLGKFKKGTSKKWSVAKAKSVFNLDKITDNEADAINIGVYYINEQKREMQIMEAKKRVKKKFNLGD